MRINVKAISGFVGTTLFIMLMMWSWGYISLINSDMYIFSKEYVSNSPKIVEVFGDVQSVSLGFLNFKRKYSNGSWTGSFDLSITGAKNTGKVHLTLKSSDEGWQVLNEEVVSKN